MINDAVEAMFDELLDWPFDKIHLTNAVPTAEFHVRFKAPSRLGDPLVLSLEMNRLGNSSLSLTTIARRENTVCFEADQVLVCVGPNGKPVGWPEPLRKKVNKIMEPHE